LPAGRAVVPPNRGGVWKETLYRNAFPGAHPGAVSGGDRPAAERSAKFDVSGRDPAKGIEATLVLCSWCRRERVALSSAGVPPRTGLPVLRFAVARAGWTATVSDLRGGHGGALCEGDSGVTAGGTLLPGRLLHGGYGRLRNSAEVARGWKSGSAPRVVGHLQL